MELTQLRARLFGDYCSQKSFVFSSGIRCKNLIELLTTIRNIDEEEFKVHVSQLYHKNEFAKWIGYVLGDNELAHRLDNVWDKQNYLELISHRIAELQ